MANSFGSISKFCRNRDQLVFGYCKQNYIIPQDLTHIIIWFYNDITEWKLEGDQLKKFYEVDVNERINGPKFQLSKHFEFRVQLNPKDPYGSGGVHTILLAKINFDLVPKTVKTIQIYYVLYFAEMNLEYRQIDTLRRVSDGNRHEKSTFTSSEWYAYLCKYNKVKKRNFKQFHFGCYFELLRVNYNDESMKWFNPGYRMQIECDYLWTFDTTEMKRFKQSGIDYGLYSNNFNNNSFCVVVAPNGITVMQASHGFVMMKIKLLRLPDKIEKIEYKYHLKMEVETSINETLVFDRHMQGIFSYQECGTNQIDKAMKLELFEKAEQITITANIIVTNVYGIDHKEIPRSKWADCGFIV